MRLKKIGGILYGPETLAGSSCGCGHTSSFSLSCFPSLLTGLSRGLSFINHLPRNVWLRVCSWENLMPDALGSLLTLQLLQASWPFCFQICSCKAGKSPSSPMFISSQRAPPPLQTWGPPTSWALGSKWLTGNQPFLIAYYHRLCTYFHFILSPFQVPVSRSIL